MIYLLAGSHTIIKVRDILHSNSRRLQAVCYRIDLNDAIRLIYLCIVYTFSKIFFTCNYPKIIQRYVGGIMTKESCLIYVL